MQKDRIRHVDLYQGIGIILVVYGNVRIAPELFRIWIESFGLLLFFVAEGYYIGEHQLYERNSAAFAKERLKEIMFPYFWIGLFSILLDCIGMFLSLPQYTKEIILGNVWGLLSFYGGGLLWFLPVFFIAVTAYQMIRKRLYYSILLTLSAILAVVICGINGVPEYVSGKDMSLEIFILQAVYALWRGCIGIFFCAVGEGLSILLRYLKEKKWITILAGFVLSGLGTWLAFVNGKGSETELSFRYLSTGEMLLFFLAAICLCSGILFLCYWIGECAPLEYIGKSFLIILATYMDLKILELAEWSGDKIFDLLDHTFIRNMSVLLIIIGLEAFLVWLFHGWLGFMFGQRIKPRNKTEE